MNPLVSTKLEDLKQQYDQLSDDDKAEAKRHIRMSIQIFEAKKRVCRDRSLDPAIKLLCSLLEYAENGIVSVEAAE